MRGWGIVVTLVLLLAGMARAEIVGADSVEWMTVDSALVVQGQVASAGAVPETVTAQTRVHGYTQATITVNAVLKGTYTEKTLILHARYGQLRSDLATWQQNHHQVLFFLKPGDPKAEGGVDAGAWVPRGGINAVIDLDAPGKTAISAELTRYGTRQEPPQGEGRVALASPVDFTRVLKTAADILAAVKARVAYLKTHPQPPLLPAEPGNLFVAPGKGAVALDVTFSGEAFYALWAGSSVYLIVPADPELRTRALTLARDKDMWTRLQAVQILRYYPDTEVIALLRTLLNDPGTTETRQSSGEVQQRYPVRDAAREALHAMGVATEMVREK